MTRWLWVLALPYVVNISTTDGNYSMVLFKALPNKTTSLSVSLAHDYTLVCNPTVYDCESVLDLAAAMNKAHAERTK